MSTTEPYKIAVIMTCYNRKETTIKCLKALFNQEINKKINLKVYLVDDGCTDGTGDAVSASFQDVIILKGDGNLYWNGGMYLAFSKALEYKYDYYLWLNDDTILYSYSLQQLLNTSIELISQGHKNLIIVGTTCDPVHGKITYGGSIKNSFWHPLRVCFVIPEKIPKPCDTSNGNCVLISREAAEITGNLDPNFKHAIGDYDYMLRAKKKGASIWVAPGFIGTCSKNPDIFEASLTLNELMKIRKTPKGLSIREWIIYTKRHAGNLWPFFCLMSFTKLFLKAMKLSILKWVKISLVNENTPPRSYNR